MNLPKVTIVTPSFNQGKFLEQTIQSVLAQDYPNIEYIVMDGGSTDGSVDIIKRYEKRLAYWQSEPDGGQSHAINKGFARASGEIFNWLNSDDLLMPSAVRIAVDCFGREADTGMIYGDRVRIDPKGNILTVDKLPAFQPREMLYNLGIPQETVFVRRKMWEQAGGLDESLHFCMDYDMWIRLSRICRIRHIPFVLGAFRLHEDSKTGKGQSDSRVEIERTMVKHFGRTRTRLGKRLYRAKMRLRAFFEVENGSAKEARAILRMVMSGRE